MTLNRVMAVILHHFTQSSTVAFTANYIKLTKGTPIVSATEIEPKDSSFWQYMIRGCGCVLLSYR